MELPISGAMVLAVFLCCTFSLLFFISRRKIKTLQTELKIKDENLQKFQQDLALLQKRYNETLEFRNSMSEAELTTKIQTPRLKHFKKTATSGRTTRYELIQKLAQKGLNKGDIADALSLSEVEVEQILTLVSLKR